MKFFNKNVEKLILPACSVQKATENADRGKHIIWCLIFIGMLKWYNLIFEHFEIKFSAAQREHIENAA